MPKLAKLTSSESPCHCSILLRNSCSTAEGFNTNSGGGAAYQVAVFHIKLKSLSKLPFYVTYFGNVSCVYLIRPNCLTSAWGSWNRTLLWLRTGVGAWKCNIVRTNISKLTMYPALPGSLAHMKIVSAVFLGRLHCSEVVVSERKVLTPKFTATSESIDISPGSLELGIFEVPNRVQAGSGLKQVCREDQQDPALQLS